MLGCWAITEHKTIKGTGTKGSTDTINYPISSRPGSSVKASDCLQQILCGAAKLLGAAQGRGSAEGVPSSWNFARCPAATTQLSRGALLACFPWAGGKERESEFFCGCHSVPHGLVYDPVLPSLRPAFGQHLCARISLTQSSSFLLLYPPATRSLCLETGIVYRCCLIFSWDSPDTS